MAPRAMASAATPYRSPQKILDASAASDRQYRDDCSDAPWQSACRTPLNQRLDVFQLLQDEIRKARRQHVDTVQFGTNLYDLPIIFCIESVQHITRVSTEHVNTLITLNSPTANSRILLWTIIKVKCRIQFSETKLGNKFQIVIWNLLTM